MATKAAKKTVKAAKEISITTYDWGESLEDIGFNGMFESQELRSDLAQALDDIFDCLNASSNSNPTVELYKIVATKIGTYQLGGLVKIG